MTAAERQVEVVPSSSAILSEDSSLRRLPRSPGRRRPPAFYDRFESRALFYDAFRHADGRRVLLVGPPPLNLRAELAAAQYTAAPSGSRLQWTEYISESVMLVDLQDVPDGTTEVIVSIAGREYVLPIRDSFAAAFAGRNLLFTMSRDNDLAWIDEWARYHVRRHGVDAVVLFDNGSTRYGVEDLTRCLGAIPHLAKVAVLSWPFIYGAPDPAVVLNPFYTQFLQVAAMSVALRRFAPLANGLLNLDVDELVETPHGSTVFDLAKKARHGLIVMRGRYMEAVAAPGASGTLTHRDFPFVLKDMKARQSRQKKWCLDPRRPWVQSLAVHPYMHWIHGRPAFGKSTPDGVFYRHFRGINTNWKDNRADASRVDPTGIELDPGWPDATA